MVMLEALFGNKTATLVLLFLERNGEVYPTQISAGFQIPVNMIQKQLERLERGGVLVSTCYGRRKVYKWNKNYPLYYSLRNLLKRGVAFCGKDPADGSYLSCQERLEIAEDLYGQAEKLNPYKRYRPFVKSFKNFKSYEAWCGKQKNPWLV